MERQHILQMKDSENTHRKSNSAIIDLLYAYHNSEEWSSGLIDIISINGDKVLYGQLEM